MTMTMVDVAAVAIAGPVCLAWSVAGGCARCSPCFPGSPPSSPRNSSLRSVRDGSRRCRTTRTCASPLRGLRSFVATLIVVGIVGLLISGTLKSIGLGALDRILGALFGLARGRPDRYPVRAHRRPHDPAEDRCVAKGDVALDGREPRGACPHFSARRAGAAHQLQVTDHCWGAPSAESGGVEAMCGILGVVSKSPVNQLLYDGLLVLQHRGQDAAGIVTAEGNRFHMHKASGMVRDVFRTRNMRDLSGNMGIAHCRYPTAGSAYNAAEAQPFYVNSPYGIVLGHNGNLTNTTSSSARCFARTCATSTRTPTRRFC